MNLLAIETSSPVLSVAFKKGKGPLAEKSIHGSLSHAEKLVPLVSELLKKGKTSLEEVDAFLIGRGPGSFTGLRIGFATLKGFLVTKKVSCFGGMSLDAIAENVLLPEGSHLAVCLDARREKIYMRRYQRSQNRWIPQGKPEVDSCSQTLKKFPAEVHVTGDAFQRYQKDFEKQSGKKKIHFLSDATWYPKASTLIEWFEKGRKDGVVSPLQSLKKPADFIPLYFRLSEAEEKKSHAYAC